MARPTEIPVQVLLVVGDVLGSHYYSHRVLNALFAEAGAPGEPPPGNCVEKCQAWFRACNADAGVDPFSVLGRTLAEVMEMDAPTWDPATEALAKARQRIESVLSRNSLRYLSGGKVVRAGATEATRTLADLLRARDLGGVDVEFARALKNVETDPPTGVTAACSILEALFKVIIEDDGLGMPSDKSVKPLWSVVQRHLGLDPKTMPDDDLRKIVGALAALVDGLGSLRTHVGSAHGHGRAGYRPAPRHARLAVAAAHTLAAFVIETWDNRKKTSSQPR